MTSFIDTHRGEYGVESPQRLSSRPCGESHGQSCAARCRRRRRWCRRFCGHQCTGCAGTKPRRRLQPAMGVIVPATHFVAGGSIRTRWYSGTVSGRRRSRSIRSTVIKLDAGRIEVWRVRAHRWLDRPDHAIQAATTSRTVAHPSIVPAVTAALTRFFSPVTAI